jgi:CBS domain-containing protein
MNSAPETVGELMTRDVVTVAPDETVERAVQSMVDRDIGCVVVVDGDRVVGMFTERDLTRRTLKDPGLLTRSVSDVMSSPVVTVEEDMTLDAACQLMISEGIRRLVVTEGGRLVGIVTERDVVRWVDAVVRE